MKKSIYGSRKKDDKPCVHIVPPEQDVNMYMLRLIDTIVSITDKTSKDNAILRMENMVGNIQTVLNMNPNNGS